MRKTIDLFIVVGYWCLALAFSSAPSKAAALVSIRDIVHAPDGGIFCGMVSIIPAGYGVDVRPPIMSVPISGGMLELALLSNEGQSSYTATFVPSSAAHETWTEKWTIQFSSRDLRLDEVRGRGSKDVSRVDSPTAHLPTSDEAKDISLPIPITGVSGLTQQLGSINSSLALLNTTVASLTSTTTIRGEVPTGAINGTNITFSLANTPSPASSLALFRNGVRLCAGSDYTLSGSTVSFVSSAVPGAGDLLLADYSALSTAK